MSKNVFKNLILSFLCIIFVNDLNSTIDKTYFILKKQKDSFVNENGQIDISFWTSYSFMSFYRQLVNTCPKVELVRVFRDGSKKDVLGYYFNSLNDAEIKQLQIDAIYDMKSIPKSQIVSDFQMRFCAINQSYLDQNYLMLQVVLKYRDKFLMSIGK